MSKYEPLWNYVKEKENDFILNYEQVEKILGFPIDHSFLTFKKELTIAVLPDNPGRKDNPTYGKNIQESGTLLEISGDHICTFIGPGLLRSFASGLHLGYY